MTDKKTKLYPSIILMMIGGFILFLSWSAMQAGQLGNKVIDADYYSKGLKYNTTEIEQKAAESMGWNLETTFSGRALTFHLTDREGSEVEHAAGTLYLAVPDRAENVHLPLQEITSGNYLVTIDSTINGTIQARLEMERQGARLNRQLLLNL